jgi:Transposase DDE domain
VLHKPTIKPDWMSQADYDQAPSTLMVRELRTGGKTLVTTLLCPKNTHKSAMKTLFQSRWHVELDLRTIKSTLGMEQLSCQTPTMAIEEMWVHLLAYNLIRLMMAQAALRTDTRPCQLSFKHTLQLWVAWEHHGQGIDRDEKHEGLLGLIAQQRVGNRPGRLEPRAIKRRPKLYPLLTKPRAIAREDIRKYGHPEKLK